jgi:aspartate/methionine/tyrosine aminotransferase
MQPRPFALERYFARYEFSARFLLSSSDCDGLPMAELLSWADDESRALWDGLSLGYTESPGHPLLRREIAGLYEGVEPDEIIEFVPEEAIFTAMHCLLEPGDHVICTYPGYQSLHQLAEDMGCRVDQWTPHEDRDWCFDPADLEALMKPETKLVIVNFPHNPTGFLPSRADFERVVEIVRQVGAYLFCDEMYRFLEQDPVDRLPSAVELYDKAVVLFGMSKTYGLAGCRTGWLVCHDEEARARFQAYKDWLTICGSAPSEILSLIGLRNHDRIVQRNVSLIRSNVEALASFAAAHPDFIAYTPPLAGSITFARLLSEQGSMDFAERVVKKAGIMVAPSALYGYGDHHIRIGFGRQVFPQALERLDSFLKEDGGTAPA